MRHLVYMVPRLRVKDPSKVPLREVIDMEPEAEDERFLGCHARGFRVVSSLKRWGNLS